MYYNWNGFTTMGLVLILYGILIILFPPKYGSNMFGIFTKITIRTKDIWLHGQKLYAYALIILGLIYLFLTIIRNIYQLKYLVGVILLIVFLKLTRFSINIILTKKYPNY
jgi:hypothetical protein